VKEKARSGQKKGKDDKNVKVKEVNRRRVTKR